MQPTQGYLGPWNFKRVSLQSRGLSDSMVLKRQIPVEEDFPGKILEDTNHALEASLGILEEVTVGQVSREPGQEEMEFPQRHKKVGRSGHSDLVDPKIRVVR